MQDDVTRMFYHYRKLCHFSGGTLLYIGSLLYFQNQRKCTAQQILQLCFDMN